MCGIVAFIGKSLDRQASFDLTSSLLVKTEVRGDDAAGFWASDCLSDDQDGSVIFSKAPVRSREFVNSEAWKMLRTTDVNLLVSHCRKSTVKGSENKNRNNHPFLSSDSRSALVHNGNIPEYDILNRGYDNQKGYETFSDCDSEILLRIMERGSCYDNTYLKKQLGKLIVGMQSDDSEPKLIKDCADDEVPQWAHTLLGIRDVFARINFGAMACAVGERWEDGTRALWLFRDRERPLQVIDMRETLNQIYIVSEKKIWRESVEATPSVKRFVKASTPIIEFPAMYIWLLTYQEDAKNPKKKFGVRRFKLNRRRIHDTTFEQERPDALISPPKRKSINVVTNLTSSDESDWRSSNVKVVSNGIPIEKKESAPNIVPLPAPELSTRQVLPNTAYGRPSEITKYFNTEPKTYSDEWPDTCFPFMYKFLVRHFDEVAGGEQLTNLNHAHHLREAAYSPLTNIPDPQIPTSKFDYGDFQRWATALSQRNWSDRIRRGGVSEGEHIQLWHALREAREAWIEHLMTCAKKPGNTIVDDDPAAFIVKYIQTTSEKFHRPFPNENQGYEAVLASQIKTAVATIQKEWGIGGEILPDLDNRNTNINSNGYKAISQVLQVDSKWHPHCRRNTGSNSLLWLLLKESHQAWQIMIRGKNDVPASIKDQEYRLADASTSMSKPNPASFEDDEEPNTDVTDHEVERPLGSPQLRTGPMTVRKPLTTSSDGDIDVSLSDRYNDIMARIKATISKIDDKVTSAMKARTINSEMLQGVVDSLSDTADDLKGCEFTVEASDSNGDDVAAV